MRSTFKLFRISLILILFAFSACNIFSDKESTTCDDTKMDAEEPTIYLKAIIPFTPALLQNSPEKVVITGDISKIFCSGQGGDEYSYDPYFMVDSTSFDQNKGTFVLPQPYQFEFENTRDRLVIKFQAELYLENGALYESEEFTAYYFYEDLMYNEDDQQYYLIIEPNSLKWFEVN
ncbi:hypothetical protein [Maribellus mangrovi]|uniref:hypothetical protein n=1 Tax=Maribellus mangrovi TaxID=3133146 RepID=UPI0030ED718F